MDIDISDPAFSLGLLDSVPNSIPDVNEVITTVNAVCDNSDVSNEYTSIIFIGIAMLMGLVGIFIFYYKRAQNLAVQSEDIESGEQQRTL
jgi:hypothetical protein